ncbi:MAG: hypothetical protein JNG86_11445, partial [Verrucomicrobiaceae bacterium]|nr:hypothetical protein [Verrucomicrobiaceae bacterium]
MVELDHLLACPVDGAPLRREGEDWISESGRRYSSANGIPVLLRPKTRDTIGSMAQSRHAIANDPWRLDTLDMIPEHRVPLREEMQRAGADEIDPVVKWMIAATCGN